MRIIYPKKTIDIDVNNIKGKPAELPSGQEKINAYSLKDLLDPALLPEKFYLNIFGDDGYFVSLKNTDNCFLTIIDQDGNVFFNFIIPDKEKMSSVKNINRLEIFAHKDCTKKIEKEFFRFKKRALKIGDRQYMGVPLEEIMNEFKLELPIKFTSTDGMFVVFNDMKYLKNAFLDKNKKLMGEKIRHGNWLKDVDEIASNICIILK